MALRTAKESEVFAAPGTWIQPPASADPTFAGLTIRRPEALITSGLKKPSSGLKKGASGLLKLRPIFCA